MEGWRDAEAGDELRGPKVDTCSEDTLKVNDYGQGEFAEVG